jgi:hypothetical protein
MLERNWKEKKNWSGRKERNKFITTIDHM